MNEKKTFGVLDTGDERKIREMEEMLREKYDSRNDAPPPEKAAKIISA